MNSLTTIAISSVLLWSISSTAFAIGCPCFSIGFLDEAIYSRPGSICVERKGVSRRSDMRRVKTFGVADRRHTIAFVEWRQNEDGRSVVVCGFNGHTHTKDCGCRFAKAINSVRMRFYDDPMMYKRCKHSIVRACMARGAPFR